MSCPLWTTVRQYTSNTSFKNVPLNLVKEFHVVLCFAKDNNNDGKFIPHWNEGVTAAEIQQYKQKYNIVKFFVAIGGYSLRIPQNSETWISNATNSLAGIIRDYHLDGIDIYYEDIADNRTTDFVYSIGKVIDNLKNNNAFRVAPLASIATTEALNAGFYYPLYQNYSRYIDWVVYQIYHENERLPDIQSVMGRLIYLATHFYKKGNLLSGGSFNPSDWGMVSLCNYIAATGMLSLFPPFIIAGASIWTGIADTQSDAAP